MSETAFVVYSQETVPLAAKRDIETRALAFRVMVEMTEPPTASRERAIVTRICCRGRWLSAHGTVRLREPRDVAFGDGVDPGLQSLAMRCRWVWDMGTDEGVQAAFAIGAVIAQGVLGPVWLPRERVLVGAATARQLGRLS